MFLLFLDTETSGVNNLTDQIIEIGGVLVCIDDTSLSMRVISDFQSLVSLRHSMDPIITRLTGISEMDLATAPKLLAAQDRWLDWLETNIPSGSKVMVIGHSLDFDLGFINKEQWYLPQDYQAMDTLCLTKILLPNLSAVNLEFLYQKLDLIKDFPSSLSSLASHRALFDTYCCYFLFQNLLRRLANYKFDSDLVSIIQRYFIPIDLNSILLSQKQTEKVIEADLLSSEIEAAKTSEKLELNWNGEVVDQNWNSRFDQAYETLDLAKIKRLIGRDLPFKVTLILAQIWAGINIKTQYPQLHLNFHGQSSDYILLNLIFETFSKEKDDRELDLFGSIQKTYLAPIDNLSWQIDHLSRHWFNLGRLIDLLELWQDLSGIDKEAREEDLINSIEALAVQRFLSGYDFLNIALLPLLEYNQYQWNPSQLSLRDEVLARRVESFGEELASLRSIRLGSSNPLGQTIVTEINRLLDIPGFNVDSQLTFHQVRDKLQISWEKADFDLAGYFQNLIEKYPGLELQSYLNGAQAKDFLELINLQNIVESESIPIQHLAQDDSVIPSQFVHNLTEFLTLQSYRAIENQLPILMLAGNNPVLRDCERILTERLEAHQYLILGESGSLTKIRSKLSNGFIGLVILKAKDLAGLYRGNQLPNFEQVIFLKEPYLIMPKFWHDKNYDSRIRHFNFLSSANQARQTFNCPVTLVEL